jgi:hypothetical protein
MDISQAKIPKWVALILILLIVGFGIYLVLTFTIKKTDPEGCFHFNDGTLQGWTLDQLYVFDSDQSQKLAIESHEDPQVKIPYEPFELSNIPSVIQAYASTYQIPDSTVEHCKFYFVSPDLSDDPNWQNISGFRFDITREFKSSSGDLYNHKVFAEIIVENESGDEEILFEKIEGPDQKNYMPIRNLDVPYYFGCIPVELSIYSSTYTIKQLRIGCIIIGYNFIPNVQFNGGWELTNVCPVY